ncbi:MAG: hypothetical protein WB586_26920, partial [Chthoniobacterales bacterium]
MATRSHADPLIRRYFHPARRLSSPAAATSVALFIANLAFFGVFFVLPIVIVLRGAFLDQTGALTLDYLIEVFRNPVYREGFANALKLAAGSTGLAFVI